MGLFGCFEVRAVPQAGSECGLTQSRGCSGVPGTCISAGTCVVQKHCGQRSQSTGSGISAVTTQLRSIQILVTPLDHDLPFLVIFSFFGIERSSSVRCNCSCTTPLLLQFGKGLVRAVLLLPSIFSFLHSLTDIPQLQQGNIGREDALRALFYPTEKL